MSAWRAGCLRVIHYLLCRPQGGSETAVAWTVALLTLALVMRVATRVVGLAARGEARQALSLVAGLGIGISVASATTIHLLPLCPNAALEFCVLFGFPLLAVLLVGLPMQMILLKARYSQAVIAFGSSVAAAGLLLAVTNSIFDSLASGKQESSRIRQRKVVLEEFLAH